MQENEKEQRLERLRKLWKFAVSQGKTNWAERIKKDAEKIKSEATLSDFEKLFGGGI